MKHINLTKGFYKATKYINTNSANILTGLGIAGVATTAIMGIKSTPKALRILDEKEEYKLEVYNEPLTTFEKLLSVTPVYFPTILMGAATMSCIYGANHINKQQQAILTGAYSYLNTCYNDYKNKVKELYGEDADSKVKQEIAKDEYIKRYSDKSTPTKNLYYDEYSQRYFEMEPDKLTESLYEINKMYNLTGEMKLNDVYEYLDLEPTDYGETVGWAATKDWECNGFSWIDIHPEPIDMPDNLECYALKFNVGPSDDYIQWTW